MKKTTLILLLLATTIRGYAQFDVSFANYWAAPAYFNPAATGSNSKLNVNGIYSMQMRGFEDAPATMYFGADLPIFFLGPKHGIGVSFMSDKIGFWDHKNFAIQYAFHQKLWGGTISVGLKACMLSEAFDGSNVKTKDSGDNAIPTSKETGSAFDLGMGVMYETRKWNAGFSAFHILAPVVSLGDEKNHELAIDPVFNFMAGYNISLPSPLFTLHPSLRIETDLVAYRGDVTFRGAYNSDKFKMYAGVGYSPTISVSFLAGTVFHGVQIGYAYEMPTTAIGAVSGNHEIVLSYQTELNLYKKGKNKHKSVRIL